MENGHEQNTAAYCCLIANSGREAPASIRCSSRPRRLRTYTGRVAESGGR